MRRVVLESPYAGEVADNVAYAKRCIGDCLRRKEAPIASHLLFTQRGILLDSSLPERQLGIDAGHAWISVAEAVVVYVDRGVSSGMKAGVAVATKASIPVEVRSLGDKLSAEQLEAARADLSK